MFWYNLHGICLFLSIKKLVTFSSPLQQELFFSAALIQRHGTYWIEVGFKLSKTGFSKWICLIKLYHPQYFQPSGLRLLTIYLFVYVSLSVVPFLTLQVVYQSYQSLAGLHKLWYPGIWDTSMWRKFGAHGEHGDVFQFSNLGALWFSENLIRYSLHVCLREVKNNLFSFKHSCLRHFSWRF